VDLDECRGELAAFMGEAEDEEVLDKVLIILYRELDLLTKRVEALEDRYV